MASGDAEASEVMINRINIYITYFLIALLLIELIYIKTLMIIIECKYLRDGVGRRRCGGERPAAAVIFQHGRERVRLAGARALCP
jgi:hypothetical protein